MFSQWSLLPTNDYRSRHSKHQPVNTKHRFSSAHTLSIDFRMIKTTMFRSWRNTEKVGFDILMTCGAMSRFDSRPTENSLGDWTSAVIKESFLLAFFPRFVRITQSVVVRVENIIVSGSVITTHVTTKKKEQNSGTRTHKLLHRSDWWGKNGLF